MMEGGGGSNEALNRDQLSYGNSFRWFQWRIIKVADNGVWRIIERCGESRATELRKSVLMVLMADIESGR